MGRHSCDYTAWSQAKGNYEGYGAAVYECSENEAGEFWAGNMEYGSRVNFCPFCGAAAPVQVELSNG